MLVPKTKLDHLSGKGRLTGEQVDAIKRDLQVRLERLDVLKCYFFSSGVYCVPCFLGIFGLVCHVSMNNGNVSLIKLDLLTTINNKAGLLVTRAMGISFLQLNDSDFRFPAGCSRKRGFVERDAD